MTTSITIIILFILLVIELLFKPRLEFTNWYRNCYLFYGRGVVRKYKLIW